MAGEIKGSMQTQKDDETESGLEFYIKKCNGEVCLNVFYVRQSKNILKYSCMFSL